MYVKKKQNTCTHTKSGTTHSCMLNSHERHFKLE